MVRNDECHIDAGRGICCPLDLAFHNMAVITVGTAGNSEVNY